MDYEERIAEAAILKIEGNELFKEKRFKEAIVKYNTGLSYLHQLPNEFSLSNKVMDLRVTLNLNIVNCHLSLTEYNYALKKLEEIENTQNIQKMKNFPPVKFYYYRCSAYMNLGEFDKAGQDFKILKAQLPNDPLVKQLENDFIKIKENTINKKKGMIKKGMFGSNLYEDVNQGNQTSVNKKSIPKFDVNNSDSKLFYIDLLINKNSKDPQKIKFEIFKNTVDKIKPVFDLLDDQIKNKLLIKREVVVNYDEKLKQDLVVLSKIENSDEIKKLLDGENNFKPEINIYAPCEEYLLVLKSRENSNIENNNDNFSIAVTSSKISDDVISDVLVIGRGIYNPYCIEKIINLNKQEKVTVDVTDCGYSKMLI
jgi:tetratricopeptide (TPR) repeat protein